MITDAEVEAVAALARELSPAEGTYIEDDYVMNLFETVLDYQMHTTAVVRALTHYRSNHWHEIRTLDNLIALFEDFSDDQEGNTALAQHLWGYKMWTRASQLRRLTAYFSTIGVTDQDALRRWAANSSFKADFEGKVKGLGVAVYHWLVMRQGVDTVKPDTHVRRFAEAALRGPLTDAEVVEVVTRAAHRLGKKAYEVDWAIWEASRGGALPFPSSPESTPT